MHAQKLMHKLVPLTLLRNEINNLHTDQQVMWFKLKKNYRINEMSLKCWYHTNFHFLIEIFNITLINKKRRNATKPGFQQFNQVFMWQN